MHGFTKILLFIILVISQNILYGKQTISEKDTSLINQQNREAYLMARKNPDMAIYMAHQSLSASRKNNYESGIAGASLALGMAHLAGFKAGDSAFLYNHLALKLFMKLKDYSGMGRACYALSYVHNIRGDRDSSEMYSRRSLEYFQESGDKRGIVNAYSTLIYLTREKGDLENASELGHRAIETAKSIPDTLLMADALNNLGNIYKEMALFSQAIECYFEALGYWEEARDSAGLSIAYGSIGLMFFYQREFDLSLEYYRKKLAITEKSGDLWEESKTLNNMALIYNERKQYDSSLLVLKKSLRLNESMNYSAGVADAHYNLANTLLLKTEIDSARSYIARAVQMARDKNYPALPDYLLVRSQVFRAAKAYAPALEDAKTAYQLAVGQDRPLLKSQAAILLSDLYQISGRKDLAYDYLMEYKNLQDSISNDEISRRINRLEIEYEYRRKEEAAEFARMQERTAHENRIRQQNVYLQGLVIFIILLGIIFILYYRHSRTMALYERINLEQRLFRSQMNPHFIFNSLCAVQEMILDKRPGEANIFLAKIARLMRNILENTMEEYIPLEKEMETLKLYLEVQEMRFENGFEYTLQVEDSIDPANCLVPPMLAQPCVENAIEHGLRPLQGEGRLSISYQPHNGCISLVVEDNGVGRKKAAEQKNQKMKKESVSIRLTRKRLEYYRKSLRKKEIGLNIVDLYKDDSAAGTKVILNLPCKKVFSES